MNLFVKLKSYIKMQETILGKLAEDKVTGFTGIVTAECKYLYGGTSYLLTPNVKSDGTLQKGE